MALLGDENERRRLLDITGRLRRAEMAGLAFLAVPGVLSVPRYGWGMPLPLLAGVLVFVAVSRSIGRLRRPELAIAAACGFAQAMVFTSIVLADGSREYLFVLPVVPMLLVAVSFGTRMVMVATVATEVGLVATALLCDSAEVADTPPWLFVPCVMIVAMVLLATTARDGDVVVRGTAVVDSLTGALNRVALQARFSELEAQVLVAAQEVAMIIVDLDHFKAVNDVHGHAVGDRVLKEVTARLRSGLGGTGTLYRFGGEEFVALLPATGIDEALIAGERMRRRVAETPIGGLTVTVSCGIASSGGTDFDRHALFDAADTALYTAKGDGRDQVCAAAPGRMQPPPDGQEIQAGRRQEDDLPPAERALRTHAAQTAPTASAVQAPSAPESQRVSTSGSWLIRSGVEREQLIDSAVRSRAMDSAAAIITLVALVARIPWYGWLPVVPVLAGAMIMDPLQRRARSFARPERVMMAALFMTLTASAMSTMLMEPAALFSLVLYGQLVFPGTVAFWARGAWLIWAWAALLMAVVAFARDSGAALHDPGGLLLPEALLAFIFLVGREIGRSSTEYRSRAIVDPLTGVLNRMALEARLPELEHESLTTGIPVALLLADLDHFKSINDRHGHDAGDGVLGSVAVRMRSALRPSDVIYRLGGEEFAVLLNNTSMAQADRIAQRLCSAVAAEPVAGHRITMSFGLAGTRPGEPFDYTDRFAAADTALYEAKARGRNRVEIAVPVAVG